MISKIEKKWALVLTLSVLISCGLFIFREVKGEGPEVGDQRSEVRARKTENRETGGGKADCRDLQCGYAQW